jgi:hypothetical protein
MTSARCDLHRREEFTFMPSISALRLRWDLKTLPITGWRFLCRPSSHRRKGNNCREKKVTMDPLCTFGWYADCRMQMPAGE